MVCCGLSKPSGFAWDYWAGGRCQILKHLNQLIECFQLGGSQVVQAYDINKDRERKTAYILQMLLHLTFELNS